MCVHREYQVAVAEAEGKYGKPGHHPLHSDSCISDFLLSSVVAHIQNTED